MSDCNAMGIEFEHEVESKGRSMEIGVHIRTSDIAGGMSSGEAWEWSNGEGDDGGDSDKRGAGSIGVGRWDVSTGEDEEDEVGIRG